MTARLFGTNGIRGVVNQEMNASFALEVGAAIGTYMGERWPSPPTAALPPI